MQLAEQADELLRSCVALGSKPSVVLFNIVLCSLADKGLLDRMESVADLMDNVGVAVDDITLDATVGRLVGSPNHRGLSRLWMKRMRTLGVVPTVRTFNSMLSHSSRNGLHEEIQLIIDWMSELSIEPSQWTYVVLIGGYSRNMDEKNANNLLLQLLQTSLEVPVDAFNSVINMYKNLSDVESAVRVFELMPKHGVRPDVISYTSMIQVYGVGKRLDEAEGVLLQMIEDGVSPNVQTFTVLLQLYFICDASMNRVDMCLRVMRERKVLPSAKTFNVLLSGFGRVNERDRFYAMLEWMKTLNVSPLSITERVIANFIEKWERD